MTRRRTHGELRRGILAALMVAVVVASATPAGAAPDRPDVRRPPGWYDAHVYHHYSDMTTELEDLQSAHPDRVAMSSIGTSVRGRSLWCMRVEDASLGGPSKLQLYLDGEHHGNEELGGELAILLVHHLVEDAQDPAVQQVLASSVVHITPMINPDGNARDERNNADGIDLNRNYPYDFVPGGSYGTTAASEPEVKANVGFMSGANLSLYITFHTGTRSLVYPWGDVVAAAPDAPMFERFRGIAEADGLTFGPCGSTIYIAHGSSMDFAYGMLGAPAFTFEVDSQQANEISRREDIAARLSDELDVTMQLLAAAPMMTANVSAPEVDVPHTARAGGATKVTVGLDNPSYEAANNTTVTVELRKGGTLVDARSVTVDVPAEGCATAVLEVSFPDAGRYDVAVKVEFRRLQVENATNATAVLADRTVEVTGGLFGGGAGGGAVVVAVIACLAIGALLAWRWKGRRRTPSRPGDGPGSAAP
jgi:hypothetical protein